MNDLAKLISAIALVALAVCGWMFVQTQSNSAQNYTVVQHGANPNKVGAFNKQTGELIIYSTESNQFNVIDFNKKIKYGIDLNNGE